MFTGIIEAITPLLHRAPHGPDGRGARLWLLAPPEWQLHRGQSIAVCGVCLTVVDLEDPDAGPPGAGGGLPDETPGVRLVFDLSKETLDCTWFGRAEPGACLNLERAMRMGDRLDGHMVSGHVDGVGRLLAVEDLGDGGREIVVSVPDALAHYVVDKGSITLDGISLTVVRPDEGTFRVALIPETLVRTNLGSLEAGAALHVEADMVGKWIARLLPGA